MDGMNNLLKIVQREVEDYSSSAIKATTYAISDRERQIYTVLIVPDPPRKFEAGIIVMARVIDDKVVIDEDTTDKPLWKELVRAGISREQIILTYAGEAAPENTPAT